MNPMLSACDCWLVTDRLWHSIVAGELSAIEHEAEQCRARAVSAARKGIAVVPIYGVMTQYDSRYGTSMASIRAEVNRAAADDGVDVIVMPIHSPGGTVYGTEELANDVYAAAQSKRVIAVADSMAASAAYWVGSQATQFFGTPGGDVGSIGVYAMHEDWSKLNERIGIAYSYIHAGKYKVEGHPDAPLSDEARGQIQSRVDAHYRSFVDAVARGRKAGRKAVETGFGEGRLVSSRQAVEAGMLDGVKDTATVLAELRGQPRSAANSHRARMLGTMERL